MVVRRDVPSPGSARGRSCALSPLRQQRGLAAVSQPVGSAVDGGFQPFLPLQTDDGGTRVPATFSAISDAVRWAEMIMAEIDTRWAVRK